MRARRDVRQFRPGPVPDDLFEQVLAAGHAAPSVGHSQPWRFLVVDEPPLRERAVQLADTDRLEDTGRRAAPVAADDHPSP